MSALTEVQTQRLCRKRNRVRILDFLLVLVSAAPALLYCECNEPQKLDHVLR